MWDELTQPEPEPDTGVDELLAVLGYQVKSSEMNNVAQKIQHLDHVLANDVALSQLASDSVHYNPSDLSSWLDGLVNIQPPDPFQNDVVSHNDDLQSIISPPPTKKQKLPSTGASTSHGGAWNMNNGACNMNNGACDINDDLGTRNVGACDTNNGLGTRNVGACTINGGACTSHAPNKHIVVMDTQENGIRLVHTLMACAEAVQAADLKLAETLVSRAVMLAASQAGAMRKVALFFTEALACRIYKLNVNLSNESPLLQDLLQMHFYETCPYIKFAHFTANQAILEAFEGKEKVHVVDFSMKQGLQWPALLQALALRPGGPPTFRLTAIGPPNNNKNNININSNSNGNGNGNNNETDYLEEVGWRLKHLADTINVEFEYKRIIVKSLADIEPGMLDIREDEVVAVNSVFELHRLLARPGSVEKVLDMVREMNPVILTVVEQEANHNGAVFLERFTESLHYYSTLFDSLESSSVGSGGDVVECGGGVGGLGASEENRVMSEMYLGKQICNVVACEGVDRVERHQTWTQWKGWFDSAGYESVHLGSNAYKQASMLLALFAGGDGYRVEEHNGCLMLGWHTRPLITTSAWKLRPTR